MWLLGWFIIESLSFRAEMTSKQNKTNAKDVVLTVAQILGVSDISQLNADTNLGDLGLDSLMGVEIKRALERDFDMVLSMKDIRVV